MAAVSLYGSLGYETLGQDSALTTPSGNPLVSSVFFGGAAWSNVLSVVPEFEPCASSGRAWRLWAAQHPVPPGGVHTRPLPGHPAFVFGARASRTKVVTPTAFDHSGGAKQRSLIVMQKTRPPPPETVESPEAPPEELTRRQRIRNLLGRLLSKIRGVF